MFVNVSESRDETKTSNELNILTSGICVSKTWCSLELCAVIVVQELLENTFVSRAVKLGDMYVISHVRTPSCSCKYSPESQIPVCINPRLKIVLNKYII